MVRAIFDFCPSVSEELPLFVGDVIEVLAVVDEFWLLGKKEDVTGKRYPSSLPCALKIKVRCEAQVILSLPPCLPSALTRASGRGERFSPYRLLVEAGWVDTCCPSLVSVSLSLPIPMLCLSCLVLLLPSANCASFLSSELLVFVVALGRRAGLR